MNQDATTFDVSILDFEPAAAAANDSQGQLDGAHLLAVPRFFYLDHLDRFGVKRAPALLGLVGQKAYISMHDRHLSSFLEDAEYYAVGRTGVDEILSVQAQRTIERCTFAKRHQAA